ncbi:hypothetical protein MK805_03855 [Shimazuella sp. AN120528]|uniref:hypothetical protein n=1 Tax=Shimazuella soli TaxID=1892854 RepID=UPI001F0FA678|nr:hypothetical protein [Shimazuella soli]MCH5584100.1 hypothetical protein [Shimazuella soli]
MSSEYRKNEFKKWFFIPFIPYLVIAVGLYFFFGQEEKSWGICFGISSILNLIILVPIYTIIHFKVKERVQGILLSAAVIILLTFFSCFMVLNSVI